MNSRVREELAFFEIRLVFFPMVTPLTLTSADLRPVAAEKFKFGDTHMLAAKFESGIAFLPMHEDIALIVDESIPATTVAGFILQTDGKIPSEACLFDGYHSKERLGAGKKSLSYA